MCVGLKCVCFGLLNRRRLIREMTAGSAASDAAEDRFPAWHDSSEYARAAEAAGVDVHGMLEAGVDTGKLVDFVSNYRKAEGESGRMRRPCPNPLERQF